jgi:CubicO group peptidase (beta-lactamase class C family)
MKTFLRLFPGCVLLLSLFVPLQAEGPSKSKGIAARLQPFVDSHAMAGAVALVATKDKVLTIETVGYEDVEAKKPMREGSLFWIASQSKPITAVGLMMLVDEGKVNLDDPVEKYLPELHNLAVAVGEGKDKKLVPPKKAVTIRHLLTHTSGMPFKSAKEEPTLDKLTLRDSVLSYAETPLQSEPGTKFSYSNAGINTVGRVIEVVSGMPYEDFMDRRLFGPLGMKDTTFWPNEEQLERLAKSYRPNAAKGGLEAVQIGQLKYPLNDRKRQPMPAGGLFSTVRDVARFCQMVLNGGELDGKRYLSEKAVKETTSLQTSEPLPPWGLGWTTERKANGGFGHGGAHATNMWVNREKGLILVWMVQHAGGFPKDGGQAHPTFTKAALELYGK